MKYFLGMFLSLILISIFIFVSLPAFSSGYSTVTIRIDNALDDVGVDLTGSTYTNSGVGLGFGDDGGNNHGLVVRFPLNIPKDTVVQDAHLILTCKVEETDSVSGYIHVDDVANSNRITSWNDYIARPWTVFDIVAWNPATTWSVDTEYTSPDISGLINKVTHKSTFVSGNYINLSILDNSSDNSHEKVSYSYDSSTTKAPQLTYKVIIPVCTTIGHTYPQGGTVQLRGMVSSIGSFERLSVNFAYGTSTDYGISVNCGYATQANKLFTTDISGLPLDLTYHYTAYLETSDGTKYYGSDKTFSLSGDELEIITEDATNISYYTADSGVFLKWMSIDTIVDLSVDYGTTTAMASNSVVQADATEIGIYSFKFENLDENKRYYYRAKGIGDESGTVYGLMKSFTTWDTQKSGFINNMVSWFSSKGVVGTGIYWLFCVLLMVGSYFIVREHKLLSIILPILILGAFIALQLLDIWLIILLAFSAGIVLFGIIMKQNYAHN
jgi:hypothetical protein